LSWILPAILYDAVELKKGGITARWLPATSYEAVTKETGLVTSMFKLHESVRNPSESDPLPNPSVTEIQFDRVKMPKQTAKYAKSFPCEAARHPPESNPPPSPSESRNAIPVNKRGFKSALDGVAINICQALPCRARWGWYRRAQQWPGSRTD
jgi:hypothetical protein